MTVTDIASRTYNHGWRLDPIVRSLLDTDFYKLLMMQMIREFYPDQRTTFSVINRSRHVRLAEVIDEGSGFEREVRRGDFERLGGWGLSLVDAESSRWGVHEGTTHVWFEIERPGPRLGREHNPLPVDPD